MVLKVNKGDRYRWDFKISYLSYTYYILVVGTYHLFGVATVRNQCSLNHSDTTVVLQGTHCWQAGCTWQPRSFYLSYMTGCENQTQAPWIFNEECYDWTLALNCKHKSAAYLSCWAVCIVTPFYLNLFPLEIHMYEDFCQQNQNKSRTKFNVSRLALAYP